jgi:hypothetical protein
MKCTLAFGAGLPPGPGRNAFEYNNTNLSIGPDLSYQPLPELTAHAYYTYQHVFYNQSDVYWTPSNCNKNGFTITPTCNGTWTGKTNDEGPFRRSEPRLETDRIVASRSQPDRHARASGHPGAT